MALSIVQVLRLLRDHESRNITYVDPSGGWPMVWSRARGVHVWDQEGLRYLDLTAAFGVAATGHANPVVVRAATAQVRRLPHAMGDVHPHEAKALLCRELSRLTFERWSKGRGATKGKVILCNSGFEAVEAALKTARLATGRRGVLAFEGGYHGLGYGALNATHRAHFRGPFLDQLAEFGDFAGYPLTQAELGQAEAKIRTMAARARPGAVLVEPVQARGGLRFPAPGFLTMLRRVCDDVGALLVVDEIYTGFARTGRWFAVEHSGVVPDLICLGKALTGGFPLSACVGRAELMDAAWPAASGEAIHTSTFLGNPVGCAMALAQVGEIRKLGLVRRVQRLGGILQRLLEGLARLDVPGLTATPCGGGLMAGLALHHTDGTPAGAEALYLVKRLLARRIIVLPEGEQGNVIGFTPPLVITEKQLRHAATVLEEELLAIGSKPLPGRDR
jgi:4-aminobutyrate aminotransferase-like enzyme